MITADTFFNGGLTVRQEKRGYRYSLDSVLLAGRVKPAAGDRIVDLGTGCGIISLILAFRHRDVRIWGVEIQEALAELATTNVLDNGFGDRIRIVNGDLKDLRPSLFGSRVDVVVANPPYRRLNSGRINPDSQKAVARHEIKAALGDVTRAAQGILKTGGRFVTVYPAERIVDLFHHMRQSLLEPKFLQCVHSKQGDDAKLILVEGVKGGGPGVKICHPLIIYDESGAYTEDMERMFARSVG